MKEFMGADFMLDTETARNLYNSYADMKKTPVIDYHCHINPQEIYEDRVFENITQLWLGADHYKWRQMRTCGVDEKYITGDASDYEKFEKWAEVMPQLIGNPLYIWSHYELKFYFGYEGNLNPDTCKEVWELVNAKLTEPGFSARGLIRQSNVRLICTTDDPIDDLSWHKKIAADTSFDVQVLPAWRPDKAMYIEKSDYAQYIDKLASAAGMKVTCFEELKGALVKRMDYFASVGCSVSDHGMSYVMFTECTDDEADAVMKKVLRGERITDEEEIIYKVSFMKFVAQEYNKRNWVMQLHYGVRRDNNTAMYEAVGPDTGFDCISDYTPVTKLADFLNALTKADALPKTIVYSLNPIDNTAIGTVLGCFAEGPVRGRVQQGSAWWFNDHLQGMTDQLMSFAALSSLGNFVGMLTDSRSFVSYTRHDYFRRILCNLVGHWVENGEYPADEKLLATIIRGISFNNAVDFFSFNLEKLN